MSLDEEVANARKEIVSDGYEMSFGEVINLYRDEELIINPEFQRLFRWDDSQKTRFIESILLGIPIPPIFVYQNASGIWELIDGLQRLSTLLEFVGILRGPEGEYMKPSSLEGTRLLPSLRQTAWSNQETDGVRAIGQAQQLSLKRSRVRVEILKQESDPQAKYELFQRLNTGGSQLSPQEVRNCVAVMLSKPLHDWMVEQASYEPFIVTTQQTEDALAKQAGMELVLRFLAFRNIDYKPGWDVHEYFDEALIRLATEDMPDLENEKIAFRDTFKVIKDALGSDAFKRWDGARFAGKFLISVFEVVATGVAYNLERLKEMEERERAEFISQRAKELWSDPTFSRYSGAGVRGTSRLANLLPLAKSLFAS